MGTNDLLDGIMKSIRWFADEIAGPRLLFFALQILTPAR